MRRYGTRAGMLRGTHLPGRAGANPTQDVRPPVRFVGARGTTVTCTLGSRRGRVPGSRRFGFACGLVVASLSRSGEWRNGRRARFRSVCPKGRGGSTPPRPLWLRQTNESPASTRGFDSLPGRAGGRCLLVGLQRALRNRSSHPRSSISHLAARSATSRHPRRAGAAARWPIWVRGGRSGCGVADPGAEWPIRVRSGRPGCGVADPGAEWPTRVCGRRHVDHRVDAVECRRETGSGHQVDAGRAGQRRCLVPVFSGDVDDVSTHRSVPPATAILIGTSPSSLCCLRSLWRLRSRWFRGRGCRSCGRAAAAGWRARRCC